MAEHETCCWPSCGQPQLIPVEPGEECPLCIDHVQRAWSYGERALGQQEKMAALGEDRDIIRWAKEQDARKEAERKASQVAAKERTKQPGHVYYLRLDGHIKIGWSSSMYERLRSYPPGAELIAYHAGTLETERHLHGKFAPHRSKGREWYKPEGAVLAHLEKLREIDQDAPAYRDYSLADPVIPDTPIAQKDESLLKNRG